MLQPAYLADPILSPTPHRWGGTPTAHRLPSPYTATLGDTRSPRSSICRLSQHQFVCGRGHMGGNSAFSCSHHTYQPQPTPNQPAHESSPPQHSPHITYQLCQPCHPPTPSARTPIPPPRTPRVKADFGRLWCPNRCTNPPSEHPTPHATP